MSNSLKSQIEDNKRELTLLDNTQIKFKSLLNELDENEAKQLSKSTNNYDENIKKVLSTKVTSLEAKKNVKFVKAIDEVDYTANVRNMIESEKINLLKINSKKIEIQDKLAKIELSRKTLEDNEKTKRIKSRNIHYIKGTINNEISKMTNLIYIQDNKCESLVSSLQKYKTEIASSKEALRIKNHSLDNHNKTLKDSILRKIDQALFLKSDKETKENIAVRLTLGLYLIQTHLIPLSKQSHITKTLEESEEYKLFKNYKPSNFLHKKSKHQKANSSNVNLHSPRKKTLATEEKTERDPVLEHSQLKLIFDNLQIGYEELYDLHTKILNKKIFYNKMIFQFNSKVRDNLFLAVEIRDG